MKRGSVLLASLMALGASAPAAAVDLESAAQQASAYLNFGFGGSTGVQSLRYGLQLDQGYRAVGEELLPPAMKLDFTSAGLQQVALAGLPVTRRIMRLSQDEMAEGDVAAAESAWYDPTGWGWVGWGIAGAGAVGAYVLLSDDDDEASSSGGGGGGNDDGGGDDGGGELCAPGTIPVIGGQCVPAGLPLMGTARGQVAQTVALEGIDEGTGYMGDLIAR